MKTVAKHIILISLLLSSEINMAQYVLSLTDTSTYSTTCGTINPAHWTVNNDNCSLTTSNIPVAGDSLADPPVTLPTFVRFEGSGAMQVNDSVVVQYSVNGLYSTDTIVYGKAGIFTQTLNFNITAPAGSAIRVKVRFANNAPTESWRMFDGDITVGNPVIMPIELVDFKVATEDAKVKINWTTASEKNNDFFTIEKSDDGKNFEEIGIMDGAENSTYTLNYTYFDEKPSYGIAYYRLKQTDFNGHYEYSKTVSVKNDLAVGEVSVFPNPCEGGNFNINLSSCKDKEVLVVLYDGMGNQIFSKVVLQKNETFYTAIDPKNKLNPGIYMVVGSSQDHVFFNHRLIVR